MKTVLVTGGAGYIGSHACKALYLNGLEPVTYDNLSTGHDWAVQWGPLHQGDLLDEQELQRAFELHRPDAIIHFAASSLVGESVRDPAAYYRNNIFGSFNLIEAARRNGVHHIVFSSTCAVYGSPSAVPISEDHPQCPLNPYGSSKLAIEHMLTGYDEAHGIRSVSLRYFNAAGASPEGEIGEAHACETHLIPLAIEAALGKRPPLQIFGTDYPTADGTAIRDYIHVCDLADAHVAALHYLQEDGESSHFNLGTGMGYSVRQIIDTIEQELGVKVPCSEAARRRGDPPVLVADSSRAARQLRWQSERSSLANIVRTAYAWHKDRKQD